GRWFSVTVDPIMNESGAITGGIHIIRDFTERKQAEEALMASEEQYRVLFEKSHDAIMVFAPHDNRFIKANAATARMFGAKDELAFTAYTPWDISPQRQPDGQLSSVKALVMIETALREGSVFFEWTHKRLNGEIFPATVLLNPIEISGEKLIQATVRDITEQARIMAALRESEEMVSLILNSASEGICGIDTDGNCMFCNAAGLRMLGYAQERDLIGRNMHSLIHHTTEHGQVHSPENCIFRQSIQQEESLHSADETLWKSDGTGFHAEFWSHPLKKNGRNIGAVITFIDVSQRISLENQFRHAQKMEAIGLLAGGIAHDFNNVLTAIVGNAHLALMSMTPAADGRQYIDQVLESSHRAAALAQSLLAFSRKQAIRLEPLNLNEVIARFEKIMQRLIREDIELCTVFAPDVLSIMADRGQIEQIVMNLVTNARDAMPSGGRIGIQTKAVALDRTFLDAHRYGREGQYAVLSVTDTGIGMSKELQEKIFDPFFTTKEPGKGTGLGLSMVYGIVKKHNGFINVYSELKKGTTFNLYFPLAEKKAIAKIEVAPSRPSGGTETILLAEDNISVRQMITTALRNFGYRVIEAVDGTEVVKKFSENGRDVNLVLMDGIMPGLNGKEAFRKIRELRPDMRVLFMSGYPEDVFTVNGVPEKGIDFIQKPLSLVDLLRKIREELDRNNTAS
ncbi:MAG TPA: PAS domain S-box protein, partial [Nitrospirota bacterium]|nr:PAS domain S-box protein [Nitrospirota bacterium]